MSIYKQDQIHSDWTQKNYLYCGQNSQDIKLYKMVYMKNEL